MDDSGQGKQLGTDRESGPLNRIHVDCEPHPVIFKKELDSATALGKTCTLSNQQHTRTFQTVHYFWQTLFLSLANEYKLT